MIKFDSSEIVHWADKPNAPHQLPTLIRRLVLATVPMPSLLDMPDGSSVWRSGWDGLLTVESGNPWVPTGASAWEFSCSKKPQNKATSDYDKRTADPNGVVASDTTFVFVTARIWGSKREWAEARCTEGRWADVRALDASDLVAWLDQAPAVGSWFARLIGKLPDAGVTSLDEWWENWASVTQPKIPPELVLGGRQAQVEQVAAWAQGAPSSYYVQGTTRDEAIAFLAACAHPESASWGAALLAKAVVVQTADAWRSLGSHPFPLVLVRQFSNGNVSSQLAVNRGHHVLTPLTQSGEAKGKGCRLPRLGRGDTVRVLTEMGLSESKLRSLVRSNARRMDILHRRMGGDAGMPPPPWATTSTPHSIVLLTLIGQWEGNHEGDRSLIAQLVGETYEQVERHVTDLASAADSPLAKTGNRWRFISHEEAWHLLAPRLTSSDIERFEGLATNMFGATSPKFDLPTEERHMASIMGKVLPHSDTLRSGIARGLALMAVYSDRAKNADVAAQVPLRVVSSVLQDDKGWRIWATLESDLAVLAEASPEAILNAVERDLRAEPSPFGELFCQEGGMFGETPHAGLLRALERIAWSTDHFSRVANIFAHLSELDPGGHTSLRPARILSDLFLPRLRLTEATDEHRLETLRRILQTVPETGWRLLIEAHPASESSTAERDPPSWRPWGQDVAMRPTFEEHDTFLDELERNLLLNAGDDARKWADLVAIVHKLSPQGRQNTIESLAQRTSALRGHPDLDNLWNSLRGLLHYHNSFPDAAWAMCPTDLESLNSAYLELTPVNPVAAYTWLFEHRPLFPEGLPNKNTQASTIIDKSREAAIQAAFKIGGISAILKIAEAAVKPSQVGLSAGLGLDRNLATGLAVDNLGSTAPSIREFATGVLGSLFSQSGWEILEKAIAEIKADESSSTLALADIYLSAPAVRDTWQRLENENRDVQITYWKHLGSIIVLQDSWPNPEDIAYAIQRLIAVHRSPATIELLRYVEVPHEVVIEALEAIPTDLNMNRTRGLDTPVNHFEIASLFEQLDGSEDVSDNVIARLEIPYLKLLDRYRPDLAIHREVCKDPSLFADLIAWLFKRSDGRPEDFVDEPTLEKRATIAFDILWHVGALPGLAKDGTVDAEVTADWVTDARRLCGERGRQVTGDQMIGKVLANAPAGTGGTWPCEPIRDLLDYLASHHVGIGFVNGKYNLRGVTSRGMFDGGGQEQSLADKYRDDAAIISARWPFTAQLLRKLASKYDSETRYHDDEADWCDQFA